jgi:uncharacterized damage-inducible protein DinB
MREIVIDNLRQGFERWRELAEALPDDAFRTELPLPSNSIGSQFWCLVGARESYTRAIVNGAWAGFSCSLGKSDIENRAGILAGLESSEAQFAAAVIGLEWDAAREEILLKLLEHEVQHQGQMIRYVYGLGYSFPESWKQRWALGE